MAMDNEANLRMLSAFIAARKADASRMAYGFSQAVGGLPGIQIERGAISLEADLQARDEAMVRMFLGIDSKMLPVLAVQRPLFVPRGLVAEADIVWNGIPRSRHGDPAFHISIGVRRDVAAVSGLTERHPDIIASILVGDEENKQIADNLCISLSTVKTHLVRIYKELSVASKTQAAVEATKRGILFWIQD